MGSLVSGSPCIPQYAVSLLFSPTKFSTNKIFPTSAVRVCLCFHSQSRLKNPEHLKLLRVSFVHHFNTVPSKVMELLDKWLIPELGKRCQDKFGMFTFFIA
jgi:hypothetical protein